MSYKSIPEQLHQIEKKIKSQQKALNDGIQVGIKIRNEREDIIEKDYEKLLNDPKAFLIKKALYYLEYDEDNRDEYLKFIRDYFFEFK